MAAYGMVSWPGLSPGVMRVLFQEKPMTVTGNGGLRLRIWSTVFWMSVSEKLRVKPLTPMTRANRPSAVPGRKPWAYVVIRF